MPLVHTRGFRSLVRRADHFKNHGPRLLIATEAGYEEFADWFLGQPLSSALRQFTRPWNGDIVRYDEASDVFAILGNDGFIKTCYRPDPFFHGAATNLEYYLEEEQKAT